MELGIEIFANNPKLADGWGRCGLLCNQASVTSTFQHAWQICHENLGKRLTTLFSPQHGFQSTVQDNMIETQHSRHAPTGITIYSLYSETREPTKEMLNNVDTILIDLQIVGCRVYTYKYTIAACLRAAKKHGKKVVIFDRPNPVGGTWVEGNVLETTARSFVGEFPIPMRHGLSAAEAARFFNRTIQADLQCITMNGWDPAKTWGNLNRHWVLTSPNLPTAESVYVYPGTVVFEGTNVSEGRGTTLPFQFIGAPFIKNATKFIQRTLELYRSDGSIYLRETQFQPTAQKWQNHACFGVQIHVLEPDNLRAFALGICLLRAVAEQGGEAFSWKQPPYEYDFHTLPIKLILGSLDAVDQLNKNTFHPDDDFWHKGVAEYLNVAQEVLLYPRTLQTMAAQR